MKKRVFLVAVFLAAIWIPIVQMNFHLYREFDNLENRELAKPPALSLVNLEQWTAQYDAYWSDNFGTRSALIRWNSILRVKLLRVSPMPSVILGRDSWLFYRSEALGDGHSIDDHEGTVSLSRAELIELQHRLEENQGEFSTSRIAYLVVIVPNKNTIYSEYLPDEIRKSHGPSRMDQFMAHMRAHSNVRIIDLREQLFRAKAAHLVYLKTDSHWNTYGAYVGYCEIIRALSEQFADMRPVSIVEGSLAMERSFPGGDLSQLICMQDILPEENRSKFDLTSLPDRPPLSTLVFRHDSFGDNLYPFLDPMFEKIVNIPPFAPFDFEAIRRRNPEIVLHVFAERYLPQAVHDDFYWRSAGSLPAKRM